MPIGSSSYSFTDIPTTVFIGNHCSIAANVYFHSHADHPYELNRNIVYTSSYGQKNTIRPIHIGHDVWIGEGVRILPGVTIGNGAIIGAGAVIAKDVPPFAVVVGNPQVIKRFRFTPSQIEALNRIQWWLWDKETVTKRLTDMQDIDYFIEKCG